MEPASLDAQKTSAREGSIENPEVLENVPGHVIPILEREFDDFDTESTRLLDGSKRTTSSSSASSRGSTGSASPTCR